MSRASAGPARLLVVVVLATAWGAIADERGSGAVPSTELPAEPAQETAATGVFHGVGVVTAVDDARGWVTLDHEAIKGFMCAMEMMYRVEPPRLTAGLKVGDRVAFDIDAGREAVIGVTPLAAAKP